MEIIFNKVTYSDKKKSNNKLLDNINLKITKGKIIGFIGNELDILIDLLLLDKKPNSGSIKVDNISIKKNSKKEEYSIVKNKIGFVRDFDINYYDFDTVKDMINDVMVKHSKDTSNISKRVKDALRLVGLSDEYSNKNPNELSYTEQKKVLLASQLSINPDILILDNFEKGLSFRDRDSFKKLFIKLKSKLNKDIIVFTNDISFMFDMVDNYYVINNGKLVLSGDSKSFYDDELYKNVEMPKIIEFTKYANNENANILEYTDFKELIKEIYRKV